MYFTAKKPKQNTEPMLNKFNRDLKILKKKKKPQNPQKKVFRSKIAVEF